MVPQEKKKWVESSLDFIKDFKILCTIIVLLNIKIRHV